MIIYYAFIDEFYKTHDLKLPEFKSVKHAKEFALGRYIVQQIAQKQFNITDEIILDNKKPVFKNNKNLHFSITHSNNIVAVAFDDVPVGIDIEQIIERKYEKIAKRYGKKFDNIKDFYTWWTTYEAKIKCPQARFINTFELRDGYICTAVSEKKFKYNTYLVKYFN